MYAFEAGFKAIKTSSICFVWEQANIKNQYCYSMLVFKLQLILLGNVPTFLSNVLNVINTKVIVAMHASISHKFCTPKIRYTYIVCFTYLKYCHLC